MPAFCFEDAQSQPLTEIPLMIGERSCTVLWKGAPDEEGVLAPLMLWDPAIALVEELDAFVSPSVKQRRFLVTGRKAGATELRAVEFGRKDSSRQFGALSIRVRPPQETDVDMVYRGTFLVWHRSLPKSLAAAGPLMFAATSGTQGLQVADRQKEGQKEDGPAGPLPETKYVFVARLDAAQNSVEAANKRGQQAIDNHERGIQFLRIGGNGPVDTNWGTMRVRLEPLGPTYGRDGFFLHNSHKGFSHGCIEIGRTLDGRDFFDTLLLYAHEQGKANLVVQVKYPYPKMSTRGDTLR
ncbi:hypothetical protein [Catenulispora rubra]|uniref:hypothetical protein n=1 Tax=Catenulispora rubra TaxID=280293 RepID=UPI0018921886|nr:hypothetical protein [Catenulispora rubra]